MVEMEALTQPVGIMRIMAVILHCICISLVATAGYVSSPYWVWCMFTWCFCCFFTSLILVLEFTTLNENLPLCWEKFIAGFAILESLMCLTTSAIYPTFFTCEVCRLEIAASVVSWVCFGMHAGEVIKNSRGDEGSGFLCEFTHKMKMLETFFACLIFTSLDSQYFTSPGLKWCMAVYCMCFILTTLIILITMTFSTSDIPCWFCKLVMIYNILAAMMYMSAMVIWPLYTLHNNKRPSDCSFVCPWDNLVVVTVVTVLNFIVYTMDTLYYIRWACG